MKMKTGVLYERRKRMGRLLIKTDGEYSFNSMFDPATGFYMRTGILDKDGKDTGVDPFMASYPELLDIGIMQTCACAGRCNVDCYQKARARKGSNMSLADYESILRQSEGKLFQVALGGAGDPDTHEEFEKILMLSKEYNVVPNFTTSGIAFTKEKAQLCKKYCGAVAVSEHFADYTDRAIGMLLEAGVRTNIHYVLSNKSIDRAIDRLKNNSFKKGINAVIFLLYKPVGYGSRENVLSADDDRVKQFFNLIDRGHFHHKVGFDSCSCAGILNFTRNTDPASIDFCEGGRFSAYIDANMNMMPCSFANQDPNWFVSLREHTVKEAWDSEVFDRFRYSLRHSCHGCRNRENCGGGCPIVNEVTLCGRPERNFSTLS